MLSNLGNILIILNIFITGYIVNYSIFLIRNKSEKIPKKAFYLSLYQSTFSIVCFLTLIIGFIFSDFSLITVFQNSHSLKPFFYKISGTW